LPQNVQWSVFLESLPPALFISVPGLDASRQSLPCRLNHGHVAAAKLSGIEEVPSIRTSHLSEADTSGILGHPRAVYSAYAVGNPMGEVKASIDWP
jgi:hypothetical protein